MGCPATLSINYFIYHLLILTNKLPNSFIRLFKKILFTLSLFLHIILTEVVLKDLHPLQFNCPLWWLTITSFKISFSSIQSPNTNIKKEVLCFSFRPWSQFCFMTLLLYTLPSCQVGWGYRIHQLHLCRRVILPHMTLNNLMVSFV